MFQILIKLMCGWGPFIKALWVILANFLGDSFFLSEIWIRRISFFHFFLLLGQVCSWSLLNFIGLIINALLSWHRANVEHVIFSLVFFRIDIDIMHNSSCALVIVVLLQIIILIKELNTIFQTHIHWFLDWLEFLSRRFLLLKKLRLTNLTSRSTKFGRSWKWHRSNTFRIIERSFNAFRIVQRLFNTSRMIKRTLCLLRWFFSYSLLWMNGKSSL